MNLPVLLMMTFVVAWVIVYAKTYHLREDLSHWKSSTERVAFQDRLKQLLGVLI
jgi:hypothetical protein